MAPILVMAFHSIDMYYIIFISNGVIHNVHIVGHLGFSNYVSLRNKAAINILIQITLFFVLAVSLIVCLRSQLKWHFLMENCHSPHQSCVRTPFLGDSQILSLYTIMTVCQNTRHELSPSAMGAACNSCWFTYQQGHRAHTKGRAGCRPFSPEPWKTPPTTSPIALPLQGLASSSGCHSLERQGGCCKSQPHTFTK